MLKLSEVNTIYKIKASIISLIMFVFLIFIGCSYEKSNEEISIKNDSFHVENKIDTSYFELYKNKGIDLEKLLDDYEKQYGLMKFNTNIYHTNLTMSDINYSNDVILELYVDSGFYKTTGITLYLYSYNEREDKYYLEYETSHFLKSYRLIDVNNDHRNEVAFVEQFTGQHTEEYLTILEYKNNKMDKIFCQGLRETYSLIDSNYENQYKYIVNSQNNTVDIIMTCKLFKSSDSDYYEEGQNLYTYSDGIYEIVGEKFDYRKDIDFPNEIILNN